VNLQQICVRGSAGNPRQAGRDRDRREEWRARRAERNSLVDVPVHGLEDVDVRLGSSTTVGKNVKHGGHEHDPIPTDSLWPVPGTPSEESTRGLVGLKKALHDWLSEHSLVARRILWQRGQHLSPFVHSYLEGLKGIEIGGSAHNEYGLDAINVDRFGSMDTIYKQEEWQLSGRKRQVNHVAPGDELPFQDDAVDFVFASHVLEHFPDPVRALREWVRVARTYVLLVIPHRDRTFDHDRELTSANELLHRHEAGFSPDEDRHWSVWTLESFVELCDALGLRVAGTLDPDDKVGNGFMVAIDASAALRPDRDGVDSAASG
jgi:SAM-dependent methyltransferase